MLDRFDKIIIKFEGRMYGLHLELNSMCTNFEVRFQFWLEAASKLALARWEHAPAAEINKLAKMEARKRFFRDHLEVDVLDYLDREIPAN